MTPDAQPPPEAPLIPTPWNPMDLVAVAIGGAIGAVARFAIGHWAGTQWPRHAHWATLCINALGSLVLGVVAAWMLARPWPEWVHRGVAIGLLGAFTTYSTFAMETVKLHEGERLMTAIGYVIATTVACVVLAAVGYWVTTKALR